MQPLRQTVEALSPFASSWDEKIKKRIEEERIRQIELENNRVTFLNKLDNNIGWADTGFYTFEQWKKSNSHQSITCFCFGKKISKLR